MTACNIAAPPSLLGETGLLIRLGSRKVRDKCSLEMRADSCIIHLRSKAHLKNYPDQIVKPVKSIRRNTPTRLCEKCNIEIALTRNAWLNHIKSKTHLENETDKSRKLCEKCNLEVEALNWSDHLKSKTQLENDPDQNIKPIGQTKLYEKCNIQVSSIDWDAHLENKKHQTNETDDSRKLCEKYNLEVSSITGINI